MSMRIHRGIAAVLCMVLLSITSQSTARVVVCDDVFADNGLAKMNTAARTAAVEELVATLKPGDAIVLPSNGFDDADLSAAPNDLEISGGVAGKEIYLGGYHSDMVLVDLKSDLNVGPDKAGLSKNSGPQGLYNSLVYNAASITGGPYENAAMLMAETFGKHEISDLRNSVILYLAYNVPGCGNSGGTPKVYMTGDCSDSRIYHMVETNYCLDSPAVVLENVTGPLTFLVGDTERSFGVDYFFNNSSDITLGTHRMFSGSRQNDFSNKLVSIKVSGGRDLRFLYTQCISSPVAYSLFTANTENLQIWGGSWERDTKLPDDALKVFHTPKCFGPNAPQGVWVEPVQIQDEVIFTYKGVDLTKPENVGTIIPPKPPVIPPTAFPTDSLQKVLNPRYALAKSNSGAALLAAGADPTGTRPSDAAFAKVLKTSGKLEIPEGIFMITKPIELSHGQGMAGRGPDKTVIKQIRPDVPAVRFTDHGAVLARNLVEGPVVPPDGGGISDVTIEGGKWGLDLTCVYHASSKFINLVIRDQTEAGVMTGDGNVGQMAVSDKETCHCHEFDQNRFVNCQFENTGDYGIYCNMGMTDKLFFFECDFIGQNKGGIVFNFTHMFNGSIIQCNFENIDGPGVDLYSTNTHAGYTPHLSSIESCTFTECGNETRPAIDYNWTESNSVSNTTITIKNKPWKFAYLGTAQAMYNVVIDVDTTKMIDGGAALGLRSTKQVKNARPTGNILHKVTSQGPVAFVNDANSNVAIDASVFGDYAWAYPHLFVDCQFGNGSLDYGLIQSGPNGELKKLMGLSGENQLDEVIAEPVSAKNVPMPQLKRNVLREYHIFDMTGRRVAQVKSKIVPNLKNLNLPKGMYVIGGMGIQKQHVPVMK